MTLDIPGPVSTTSTTTGTTAWIKAHLERMDPTPRPRHRPSADASLEQFRVVVED